MLHKTIRKFKGISAGIDSTDADDKSLSYAENVILRPAGAISRLPPLKKIWGLDKIQNYAAALGINPADNSCLLKITQPNPDSTRKNEILLVHDFANDISLGLFFLENDKKIMETSLDNLSQFATSTPIDAISVLKKGLSQKARWFFYSFFDSIVLGNGVDDNLIYQIGRPSNPLRLLGSNEIPDVPIVLSQIITTSLSNARTTFTFVTSTFAPPPRIRAETKLDTITGRHFMILRWTPTDSAAAYQVDFSSDISFAQSTRVTIGSGTTWQFDNLNPSSRFYFRVRAQYAVNQETFFSPFTTGSHDTPVAGFQGSSQGLPSQTPIVGIIPRESTIVFLATGTFSLAQGNNISVRLEAAGNTLSSSRSGEGTEFSPIEYVVSGISSATISQLVSYINGDFLVSGILFTQGRGEEGGLTSKPAQRLTGGVGTDEDTKKAALLAGSQIAVSYYDPGVNNQGFESGLSNPALIRSTGQKIILPVYKESASVQRFPKFRVYYKILRAGQLGSFPINKWILLGECDNEPGATFEAFLEPLDDNTVILPDAAVRIDRPPPCTVFELCADRLFVGGNLQNSQRIWYSNLATATTLLPESFNSQTQFFDMPATKTDGAVLRVTLLQTLDQTLQIHTDKGIVMMDGRTFNRRNSRSDFGAINPAAATNWKNQSSPYVGSDGVLYEMQNQQVLKSLIANETSWDYIKKFIDTESLNIDPQKVSVYGDFTNQLIWVWLPCIFGNTKQIGGFIYDYRTKGITGPITIQGLVSIALINSVDSRFIGQTENGYLVYIDSRDLNLDDFDDAFVYNGNFLENSNKFSFTTNLLDCESPNTNKFFGEVIFTLARGSKVQSLKITAQTDEGNRRSINFGSNVKEKNKIAFLLAGYNIKINIEGETINNKPFVLRDLTLGYKKMRDV